MEGFEGRLPPPREEELKEPVREFNDTFSVWTVLKEEFFPGRLTDKEKQQIGPERAARAERRARPA